MLVKGSKCGWGLLAVVALILGGCATESAETRTLKAAQASGGKGDYDPKMAAPRGYRQLLARDIAASYAKRGTPMRNILKAEITAPAIGWMGIFDGGNRPIVCVRLTVKSQGLFSDKLTYVTGYTFENGKVDNVFSPEEINPGAGGAVGAYIRNASTCGGLRYRPYPELMRTRGT